MKALLFVLTAAVFVAGLVALFCSAFANYWAFSAMMPDSPARYIWGAVGIVASVISGAAFSLAIWHLREGNYREGVRVIAACLIAMVMSIAGTKYFMDQLEADRTAQASAISETRSRLSAEISDWRVTLAAYPKDLGTIEAVESYLSEVRRVGRSHQRPYRMKLLELGQIKQRDALVTKIEAAEHRLQTDPDLIYVDHPEIPYPWFFAVVIEIFSSQAVSIAVAMFLALQRKASMANWRDSLDQTFAQ